MKLKPYLAIILLTGILMSGCGVARHTARPASSAYPPETSSSEGQQGPVAAMSVSMVNETRQSLLNAYHDWKGTPYQYGGSSRSGVDCSMFVNIVFEDYFGIELPTNTRTQLNAGEGIRRAGIRTGDLIFFRTGRKTLHVGIMINRHEFVHASTSEGVTKSRLGQRYWANRYLSARRVL